MFFTTPTNFVQFCSDDCDIFNDQKLILRNIFMNVTKSRPKQTKLGICHHKQDLMLHAQIQQSTTYW